MTGHDGYMDRLLTVEPLAEGSLSGTSFAVKDVFDIRGHISSAGNPHWKKSHAPAEKHASAVEQLLQNGAKLEGTTVTDELMYSLQGQNHHYGTPGNPRASGRIPGGSSSGSAAVVSAGLADFALGTDTGGSVRVPSAYCGIYGFRPSHGAVPAEGVIPLAPGFDTVGWMSRDTGMLLRAGQVLLTQPAQEAVSAAGGLREEALGAAGNMSARAEGFGRILWAEEAWELADEDLRQHLADQTAALLGETPQARIRITGEGTGLAEWADVFRNIQGREIWRQHQDWIRKTAPVFGPGIAERFSWAGTLPLGDEPSYRLKQQAVTSRLAKLLSHDCLLVIPTVPGEAPVFSQSAEASERQRTRVMQLTCVAGLAGLPQITVPLRSPEGYPMAVSFLASRGQDLRLLQWIDRLGLPGIPDMGPKASFP
jgi:amidase